MSITVPDASLFEDSQIAFSHKSDNELKKAYRLYRLFDNPFLKVGTSLTSLAFRMHLPIEFIVKATAYKQFCGGEKLKECESTIEYLAEKNILTAIKYSVETKASEADYNK